jgi:hypothetical protein
VLSCQAPVALCSAENIHDSGSSLLVCWPALLARLRTQTSCTRRFQFQSRLLTGLFAHQSAAEAQRTEANRRRAWGDQRSGCWADRFFGTPSIREVGGTDGKRMDDLRARVGLTSRAVYKWDRSTSRDRSNIGRMRAFAAFPGWSTVGSFSRPPATVPPPRRKDCAAGCARWRPLAACIFESVRSGAVAAGPQALQATPLQNFAVTPCQATFAKKALGFSDEVDLRSTYIRQCSQNRHQMAGFQTRSDI